MKCLLCARQAVWHFSIDDFHSPDFGIIGAQPVILCSVCSDLFRSHHLAQLADRYTVHMLTIAQERDHAPFHSLGIIANFTADLYHLLIQVRAIAIARLN